MKVLGWVLVGILVVVGVLSLDPAQVGLSETTPVLQLIALRGWLAAGAVGLGLVLLLAAVLARRTAGKGRRMLVVGIVAVLVGAGHAGVLAERGLDQAGLEEPKPDTSFDVLTLNTLRMAGGPEPVVALIDDLAPDVVALQEVTPEDAAAVAEQVAGDYQLFTHTTGPDPVQGTALLVGTAMGEYEQVEAPTTTFGGVWARPVDGFGPELLSVHPVPPVPSNVDTWRSELEALVGLCERVERVVMAGDFNATLDHATLREAACEDSSVGVGGLGTWPTDRSVYLGTTIDHVLHDPDAWRAIDAAVIDAPGDGDHRAVVVRLVSITTSIY